MTGQRHLVQQPASSEAALRAENARLRAALAQAGLDPDRVPAKTPAGRQGADPPDAGRPRPPEAPSAALAAVDQAASPSGIGEPDGFRATLNRCDIRLADFVAIRTVGVIVWDAACRIAEANDAFLGMTGFSRNDMLGATWQEITPEPFHVATRQAMRQVVAEGEATPFEKQYLRKHGAPWWGLSAPRRIGGNVIEFVLDVSARRQAEEALRQSNQRFRLIVESARDYAIFATDPEGRVTDWLPGAALVYGWTAQEIVGRSASVIFTPEDRARGVPEWELNVGRAEGTAPDVRWHLRRDGSRVFIDGRVSALRDADGTLRGFLKIGQDVTERRTADERLHQLEARQGFLLRLSDTLKLLTDAAAIEGASCRLLGEHLGVAQVGFGAIDVADARVSVHSDWNDGRIASLINAGGIDGVRPAFAAGVAPGEPLAVPDASRDPRTGAPEALDAWVRTGARAILHVPLVRDGRMIATLFIHHPEPRAWSDADIALVEETGSRVWDAVERARAASALRDANETLEARVAERTAALTQAVDALHTEALERAQAEDALRQAQKMEAVGQLTGGIAHDFNNLLQAIGGNLELAQRRFTQGRGSEIGRLVETARQTVERAAALTHRLLAFARRQALQPKRVDPDRLVEGMAELIVRTVGPAVEVELRLGNGDWAVLCDPNQLESALLNLAINARDAMPDGGRLTIGTRHVRLSAAEVAYQEDATPGDYVELLVADTGTGMDETTKARVFEPFFTTKPTGEGTGLGLSQLYGFMRQSRGVIRLESTLGEGTTVRLCLPRDEQEGGPAAGEAPERGAGVPPQGPSMDGGAILLVEDEPNVRAITAEHLRDLGFRVSEAADGQAALRVLDDPGAERPDLLVTDVGLPHGLNGRQLAEAARQRCPGLPVLLITGYAGGALVSQPLPDITVITKPFALDTLTARVRNTIGKRR